MNYLYVMSDNPHHIFRSECIKAYALYEKWSIEKIERPASITKHRNGLAERASDEKENDDGKKNKHPKKEWGTEKCFHYSNKNRWISVGFIFFSPTKS